MFIASPGSTYSFMAHARALIRPHHGSFYGPKGTCLQAPGSEAGLYMRDMGAMHDDCHKEGGTVRCDRATEGCVSTLTHLAHGCMQNMVPCAQIEKGVLDAYVAELRHSVMFQVSFCR
jgi:hypothetical protein